MRRDISPHTSYSSSTAARNRVNERAPMSSALITRMPVMYSTITVFMSSRDFVARGMMPFTVLNRRASTAKAMTAGTSVTRASGTLAVRRNTRAATGPETYMKASGRLCASSSSSLSTSSESTVLILPVLRSSSSPSGALARRSRMRQRTSNRVPYAPLCASAFDTPNMVWRSSVPATRRLRCRPAHVSTRTTGLPALFMSSSSISPPPARARARPSSSP